LLALALPLAACGGAADDKAGDRAPSCAASAVAALGACVDEVSAGQAAIVEADGALCPAAAGAAATATAADAAAACPDGAFGALDAAAVGARLEAACATEADSLAWRSYGGPHAAVAADPAARSCLTAAHGAAAGLVADTLAAAAACLDAPAGCADLDDQRAELAAEAQQAITGACPDLTGLVAIDPATFVDRAAMQADCALAASLPDPTVLDLRCGPGATGALGDANPVRGEWTRVELPADTYGTICGDGSDYAFWVRLAPEGAPLDRVLVGLQGGGVCVLEEDCTAKLEAYPELFTAAEDEPYFSGLSSTDPSESPFTDYTTVFLPYCNQDVFAGGGVVEDLGSMQLPRYGALNLRVALRMFRDLLWQRMDAEGGAGYRPDQLVALFGGFSAGSYGTLYNYHWVLDDLAWPRTVGFPDAGLALDNGEPLGVRALGAVKVPAWGVQPYLPPYCFDGDCALGEVIATAMSPRLLQVPEQQLLMLSNQRDEIQMRDAYFSELAPFINVMRRTACETRDLPGIHWFLTSVSDESVHVVSVRPETWLAEVDGMVMRDWFAAAVEAPDTLRSHMEEGDFVDVVPGVEPFPCAVGR
jgi:hypothetical protein